MESEWMYWAMWIFTGYWVAVTIVYFIQTYFFYHPEKLPESFKFRYADTFEEIHITADDGNVISALLFKAKPSRGVALYFKGNTKSIKGWSKFRGDFLAAGYDFFIFDYPGFGKSSGKPTERAIFEDCEAVYSYVKDRYGENRVVIYGRSMGSGFAARVAGMNDPALLILDSPFYSFDKLANYYSWILPLRYILKLHVPLYEYVKHASCPIVIFHGDKDKVIPYRFSVRLKKENDDKIDLRTIEGAKHNDLPTFPEYHYQLKELLNSAIK